jgi:fused signal recognition particle receptor
MFNIFKKFKDGLAKTARSLFGTLGGIFGHKQLDDHSIEELEAALYGADFGVDTTEDIINEIKSAYKKDKNLHGLEAAKIGASVLERILHNAQPNIEQLGHTHNTEIISLIGINGAGKTTTAAKLCHFFVNRGQSVLLGACDTFRAAANEQIQTWARRLDIEIVSSHSGADSAAVAYDAIQAAKSRSKNILILDTAGRLHTKTNLMEELKKLNRVLEKNAPGTPHHRWLVVDASLGSNSIEQAKAFHSHTPLTGLIITKLDGTSRGGAVVGIYRELKIPIYFVGFGEQPEDLQPFNTQYYTNSIFGLE